MLAENGGSLWVLVGPSSASLGFVLAALTLYASICCLLLFVIAVVFFVSKLVLFLFFVFCIFGGEGLH